jgi:cardiolipin synthase
MVRQESRTFWTAANILSLLRILLVPVFLMMLVHHKPLTALIIFLLAGSTDLLDGLAARIWRQKTKIGVTLDPAADKLLMTAAFVALSFPSLSSPNVIPSWLTCVVVGRDVLIASASFILIKLTGPKVFYPTLLGKSSTFCQMGVILLVLLLNFLRTSPSFLVWFFYLTLVLTVLSGIHYCLIGMEMLRKRKP